MAPVAAARGAAYQALHAVLAGRADLPDALARSRERLPDERDRALAAEITAGTIRWLSALDAVIVAFAGRPLARLDAEVRDILRLSAYQILHLDRIPASAVVNDAVELTRTRRKRSATGLVNAVLRRIDREREHLPLPPRPRDPAVDGRETGAALDYLSVTLSHPRWLVDRWLGRFGFEAVEAWARFDNEPAALTLRANTLRTRAAELRERLAAHGVSTEPTRFAPDGLTVLAGNPLRTPLAGAGVFVVQDEASQLVALAAGARTGDRVLDACAAPGGKTLAMAGEMEGRGLLVAADLRPRRLGLLRETVRAGGAGLVRIVRLDAAAALPFRPIFDTVLLDAPCSGLGTIRRDPEIRWRRTPDDLVRLAAVQDGMLEHACRAVRPGGRLVYATCSSEPEENEDRVAAFLGRHPEFEAASLATAPRGRLLLPVLDASGFVRTWPFRHGLEAFFAALLVRR
jgi:16S rRNA (cytosine967-C5)-methyltransferase